MYSDSIFPLHESFHRVMGKPSAFPVIPFSRCVRYFLCPKLIFVWPVRIQIGKVTPGTDEHAFREPRRTQFVCVRASRERIRQSDL